MGSLLTLPVAWRMEERFLPRACPAAVTRISPSLSCPEQVSMRVRHSCATIRISPDFLRTRKVRVLVGCKYLALWRSLPS